jgi:hypothetical protein
VKTKRSTAEDRYLSALKKRYRKARKKERGQILDEYTETMKYHRTHAAAVLSGRYQRKRKPWTRRRGRYYTEADHQALWQLAQWFDQIGSKKLRAALDVELPRLRAQGHLQISEQTYQHMLQMSPATMDRVRVLIPVKERILHGGTKPGSLLKSQVPIRTYADWDDKRVGFVEIDLVQHEGSNSRGIFACTLNMTDVSTGWTEVIAVRNKAQQHVFVALKASRRRLPFALLGVDSDNGGEFINDQLIRYCTREQLTFTRGRVAHKNDNAFVEQKNWSVVRRLVGYARYDTPKQVNLLNQLYAVYRLYINFFIPVTKLIRKEVRDKRTYKIYDPYCTPYQRVLNSSDVTDSVKDNLHQQYDALDMLSLKQRINTLKEALMRTTL